jgi:signal transduction histidine kinase
MNGLSDGHPADVTTSAVSGARPLLFHQEMVVGTRLPGLVLVVAAVVGAFGLSRRGLGAARARIAELEAERTQLAAEARDALRLRDDFLATLSHELRTPLNAMLGWVQLLRLHAEEPPLRTHAIDVIERNARTQVQHVTDLLDISKIISGRMKLVSMPVDLTDIVHAGVDTLAATAAAREVTLSVETHDLGGVVSGDAGSLRQVVWNLVSNAIKFTPAGGHVRVRLRPHGETAEIAVTDTGVGIAPEVLPFVFDRFRQGDSSLTRAFGGLGLGLAMVRHLVELHGGTVDATSEGRHRGATFSIRLPLRIAHQPA